MYAFRLWFWWPSFISFHWNIQIQSTDNFSDSLNDLLPRGGALYIVHFIRFYESYEVIWLHLCSSWSCVSPSLVQIHGFNFIWNFINSKIPSKCHNQWGGPCLHRTQEIRSLSRDKSIVFIYKVLRRGKSINELRAPVTHEQDQHVL